ncbi:MAG TPA: nuclear transport factor 2 family protein [Candidatus Dormibacteraeota bacterium]
MSTSTLDPAVKHQAFADACNAGDVGGLLALYSPDAIVVERTGELTRGIAAIRQHLEQLVAMNPRMEIIASTAIVNGDVAQLSSWWRCIVTTPDGREVELEFRGSELDRRQPDGSWLIAVDNPWGAEAGLG